MAKAKYVPADGYRVTVAVSSLDELVVAETDKPFETDDPGLQAELDAVSALVRQGKSQPAKAEG